MIRTYRSFVCGILVACLLLSLCSCVTHTTDKPLSDSESVSLDTIPAYSGEAFTVLCDNQPTFTENELVTVSYESYAPLDALGRCGVTEACIGRDLMPTEKRGAIGSVKPSGWQTKKYDFVDGKYLYNRCHLIGYQLSGENANEQNLITGTRFMNTEGMLPFENLVTDYVKETNNHVMYRVTPLFEGDNLVASGVQMEAYSVEDGGEGVCFHVFCYNIQPGVTIDYATGNSVLDATVSTTKTPAVPDEVGSFVLNTNSKKVHRPTCSAVESMAEHNKQSYTGSLSELLADGYDCCGACFV